VLGGEQRGRLIVELLPFVALLGEQLRAALSSVSVGSVLGGATITAMDA
jgi:hypothetical protein